MRPDAARLTLTVVAETAIAAADATLGQHVILVGLLIAGPLLAAATLDHCRTVAVAGYAIALAIILSASDHIFGTADDYAQLLVVAAGVGFAIPAAYVRIQRQDALRRMTLIAEVAQRAVLPALPANVNGMDFAYRYRSATRDASVGGDFYDVALTPAGVRLVIGDVRGNGLSAVGLSAAVLRAFRESAFTAVSLVELARYLDARLSGELGIEDFVTVVLAEFVHGEVRLVNCGHHSPLRIGLRLEALIPPRRSPPLGLRPDPTLQRARLAAGERILFYTDGLVEARDAKGEMFRADEGIADALTAPLLEDAVEGLLQLALTHTGGEFHDDLTLVLAQPADDRDTPSRNDSLPGQDEEPRQEEGEDAVARPGPHDLLSCPTFSGQGNCGYLCGFLPVQVLVQDLLRSPVSESRMETSAIRAEFDPAQLFSSGLAVMARSAMTSNLSRKSSGILYRSNTRLSG